MPELSGDMQAAAMVIRQQQVLHELTLSALRADTRQNLIFRILNETVRFAPYHRATIWWPRGRVPALLGVSGASEAHKNAPLPEEWRRLMTGLPKLLEARVLTAADFPGREELWAELSARTSGLSVFWLPLKIADKLLGGVWLERWGVGKWSADDIPPLQALADAYALAWERFEPKKSWLRRTLRPTSCVLAVVVLYVLFVMNVPLRVIATCEVVPRDPVIVSAPLAGVVGTMVAEPGGVVEKGALLFAYDKRLAREELDLAEKKVKITAAEFRRAEIQALDSSRARAEVRILRRRLEQEKVRRDRVAHELTLMDVRAPEKGQTLIDNPSEWRGRPVRLGERVMLIVKPGETMVRIWIPENDNIEFTYTDEIKIVLNVRPDAPMYARLQYISHHARPNQQGLTTFVAEAEWNDLGRSATLKPGLKGTAVLYGKNVSLAYWLMRKPVAAMRRFFGW